MKKLILTILVLILLVGLCLYLFADIVTYIVLSLVITAILTPVVDLLDNIRIQKFNFPRSVAVMASFVGLSSVFSLFIALFVPLVSEQVSYVKSIDRAKTQESLSVYLNDFDTWMRKYGMIDEKTEHLVVKVESLFTGFLAKLEINSILSNVVGATGSILVLALAVTFMSFFFLMQKGLLKNQILRFVPNAYFEMTVTAFFKIRKLLSNYLFGLLVQMFAVFIMVSTLLSIFGVKYAFTIGLFAALANLVPYVGPILGISFALLVTVTTGTVHDSSDFLIVLGKLGIAFGTVQLIDNILLQPVIFSKSIKAHPLEIFIIVFVGASLGGAVGMILAIPCYTIVRVMVQEFSRGYSSYRVFRKISD